jgi:glycosyltransferase involved in cell wall biosynthesis
LADKQLRVLQVCSARESIYGAAQALMSLAKAQRSAGKDVRFLAFAGKKFGGEVRSHGFDVDEVRVRSKGDLLAVVRISKLIRQRQIDIVHTHLSTSSVVGGLAARLVRVPCVSTVHGMSGKMSFFPADHLIAVSQGVKQHLQAQGVPAERISVVYNGLDTAFCPLPREEARRRLGIRSEIPIVGTVSRITGLKGIDDGLRAFARLREDFQGMRYMVVGEGDALEGCRELSKSLGITDSVDFVGYRTDVATYLSAMDLFLFPSLKEAMGIALIEAMACSLPIVTTNVGGIPEVVTPDAGILVGPRQPDALAFASRELLDDPARALELSSAAKRRSDRLFTAKAMEIGTDVVYRRLLGLPVLPEAGARDEATSRSFVNSGD